MTKQVTNDIKATRTNERALCYDFQAKRQIFERTIWVGDKGKSYVQYKGTFYKVNKSDSSEYDYIICGSADFAW